MNKKEIKKHERFICDYLGIKLRLYKIDYKYIEGPKCRRDCTTRTIARLLNIPYQDVLKKQLELALEYEQIHANYYKITTDILSEYGYEIKKFSLKIDIFQLENLCPHIKKADTTYLLMDIL